jgi:hypothetical protein
MAWVAHHTYHLSDRLREQQELAQRRAIEAILGPYEHAAADAGAAGHVHTGADPSVGASYAHADPTFLHRHSEGGEIHSHAAGVDRLLAAAQSEPARTVGAPTPTVARVAVHVPASIVELPVVRHTARQASLDILTMPHSAPSRLPDPPPRA